MGVSVRPQVDVPEVVLLGVDLDVVRIRILFWHINRYVLTIRIFHYDAACLEERHLVVHWYDVKDWGDIFLFHNVAPFF